MNEQLAKIIFGGNDSPFTSVNEIAQPEKLSSSELVLLENMRLDSPVGVASTRKGFSRYSQEVDTIGNINSLFDVQDANGNNFLLAAIGTKLRKSANGTGVFSDLKTGLTNNAKMRMTPFGSNFYFTNNNENPFYTDLTTAWDSVITRPDISGVTITNNAPGGTNVIDYLYVICYVTIDGTQSNVSIKFGMDTFSTATTINFTLSNLPVSSDSRVISKNIFRSKNSNFADFFLLTTLENSVTTFTDTTIDDALNTAEKPQIIDMPIKSKFISVNSDRLFLANITKQAVNRVIPPPLYLNTASSILDDTTAGNLSAGTYKWARSLIDINGNESELVLFITDTLPAGKQVTFYPPDDAFISAENIADPTTWINNIDIKYMRFYRTKADGSVYYFIADISIKDVTSLTFTYTDNAADSSLTIVFPKETVHNYLEQLILKTTLVFSDVDQPLNFLELNLIQIYPDDEDEITGIFDDNNGIIVFKQKSICKLYTNGDPTTWWVQKLVTNKGCDQPDSIYKYGSSYFFMFENKVYIFNGESAEEEISYKRKPTFDSITNVLGCTFWQNSLWYILSIQIGNNYFLLCYDTKLKTWYKYSISKADTIIKKEFGADAGKLLIGGNLFVTTYNENQIYDSDTGDKQDILIQLKTGDRSIDDFIKMRLMFFFVNYIRLHGTLTDQILFTLTDPKTNASINLTDTYDAEDQLIWRIATDGMQGRLRRTNKVNLSIYGYALSEFLSARLDYNPETWGNHFKHPPKAEGLGMNTGTKTGIQE